MDDRVLSALESISPSCGYGDWINIGMALHHGGYPCDIWDRWSSGGSNYHRGECEKHWRSFKGDSKPVTVGTIISMAKDNGWRLWDTDGIMDWDAIISYDGDGCMPIVQANPKYSEMKRYIQTLFESEDKVCICVQSYQDKDGKWKPGGTGTMNQTAAELIANLDKYREDIAYAIGDWNPLAGVWVRINPLDGNGVKNENVTDHRYALVESDILSKRDQEELYRKLELPIACMVDSAGKSIHAVVKIFAKDKAEYDERVSYLYDYLDAQGLHVDRQNKNPSRFSRLPGVDRNGKMQHLIATNIGKRNFEEWKAFIENRDDLPPFETLGALEDENEPLAPELIEGVVRCGHKLIVVGDSKSGKSFLMVELCIAIAEGGEWIGYRCKQGKVLYINLEIDKASCTHRFLDGYKAAGIGDGHKDSILIWNLRGKAKPMDELSELINARVKPGDFDAIIIDPIYKVITGDENNASDMGSFCNQFDKVCQATGATVVYCHHHSKGAQGAKKSMDRASGSGVFARDADAMLDITALDVPEEVLNQILPADGAKPFRIESTLREFPDGKPRDMWFIHPRHEVDYAGLLSGFHPAGSALANLDKSGKVINKITQESFDNAYQLCTPDPFKRVDDMAEYLGISRQTVYKKASDFGYRIDKGLVLKNDCQRS